MFVSEVWYGMLRAEIVPALLFIILILIVYLSFSWLIENRF